MTHPERDQELLLLAHSQLPPGRRMAAQWHLRRCPDCRHRLAEFRQTSRALAGTLRDPGMPPWTPPAAVPLTAATVWVLLVTTVLLLIVLGTVAVRSYTHAHQTRPVPVGGCRPDLPNDLCR